MGWQYNQGLMDHQEYMLYNNPVVVRNKETFINYYWTHELFTAILYWTYYCS
jgi:hypothetical protein